RQLLAQIGQVGSYDTLHHLRLGKTDVVKEAAAEESVGQLLLGVRGDDHHRQVLRLHRLARLVDEELHAVEFEQQIVGKFDIGLVNLVDQQDNGLRRLEGIPKLAVHDVVG